jgi:DNA replication and repair protein RecF
VAAQPANMSAQDHNNAIQRLAVENFRNYDQKQIDVTAKQVVITGPNGIGKTNLLEAISLFSPGRGLRSATPNEWRKNNSDAGWGVSITLNDDTHLVTRNAAQQALGNRRNITCQGVNLTSQAELAEILSVLWLTPQMDGLFLDESAARRKFFDRLIYAAHPEHATHIQRYEYALKQRNKLLKERSDNALIRALHPTLVAEGVAIAAARLEKTRQLNQAFDTMSTPFPLPFIEWQGAIEQALQTHSALDVEEIYMAQLEDHIDHDRLIGQTRLGVHRSDVTTHHRTKNIAAKQCSTGEQKALLLSLVLAHTTWLQSIAPHRPLILLLDDITAHFDDNRQAQIFDWITDLNAQVWLTGTDSKDFKPLDQTAQFIGL